MPTSAAQYQFAAEFALFLVAVSGLALALLRPDLLSPSRWARVPMTIGFVGLGVAAFVHGSLLADADAPIVVMARGGGLALVAIGVTRWRPGAARIAAAAGLALAAAGLVLALSDQVGWAAVLRVAGALALGGALLLAGNRSITTRVAASAAASVLLIVLVTSVGLSAVLDSQVEDSAVRRLDARAREAATRLAGPVQRQQSREAQFLSSVIGPVRPGDFDNAIRVDVLAKVLREHTVDNPRALVAADGRPVAVADAVGFGPGTFALAAQSGLFREVIASGTNRTGLMAIEGTLHVVSIGPLGTGVDGDPTPGAVVLLLPVDRTYLDQEATDDATTSLALVSASGPVAQFGDQPPVGVLVAEATKALGGSTSAVRTHGGRFIAAAPVLQAGGESTFALVASQPTEIVENTRQELFNTLFLIALGGTVLALAFAALVGERIGAGVRRLTEAALAVQGGDLAVRTQIESPDEVGVLSTAFDSMAASIGEQTRALQEAAADETRLRNRLEAIVSGMGEALVAIDTSGGITDMNEAAEALLGVLTGAAFGQRLDELATFTAEEGADLGDLLARPTRERWSEPALLHTEGDGIPVALSMGPLEGPDSELNGAVIMFRDLRRERQLERMQREFLSRVGHELRTPLTPIVGYSQMLSERPPAADQVKVMAASIHDSSQKLRRIIEMLEFFASLQAGRKVVTPRPTPIRPVLDEAVASIGPALNGSHKVTVRVARGLPDVLVDPGWLARAVRELVDNAAKFSPKGGSISVRAEPHEDATGRAWVAVTVTDRGIGMSEEQLDAAFHEWTQGDESDTRHFGGLGLGLPLVRRVAQALGGDVRAESTEGKGSKVSIIVPPADVVDEGGSRGASAQARGRRRRA